MKFQYSSLKTLYHFDNLEAIRNGLFPPPIYIRIKPTNRCNHHCSYCGYGNGKPEFNRSYNDQVNQNDMISWTKLQEIITDFGRMGLKALTFSGGGEPLTYPHILEAVRLTKAHGIDFALITNGSLLRGELASEFATAKWVRVSFDASTPAIYAKSRGVKEAEFDKVCTNLANFAKIKDKDSVLGINFIITRDNAHYVYDGIGLLKELGVDNVKCSGVLSNEKGYHANIFESVCQQIEKAKSDFLSDTFSIVSDYERNYEDRQFKQLPFHKCYIARLMTSVCADTKVYYCFMRAYDSKAELGDLREQSFRELWENEATHVRLKKIDPARDCHNQCVYDSRNVLLNDYFDMDMRHVNFI